MTYPRAWLALAGIFVINGLAANVEFETEKAIEKEAKSTHYPPASTAGNAWLKARTG